VHLRVGPREHAQRRRAGERAVRPGPQFVAAAAANATALANAKAQSEDSNRQDAASRLTTQSLAQAQEQAQATANKIDNAVQASSRNAVNDLGPYNMGPWNAWNFQDPSAHWIWSERGAAGNAATGWCVAFQKVFNSPWNTGATVHVICDDSAVVYLNGDYVGRGDGGWGGGNYNRLPVTLYADNNVLHIEGVNGGGPAGLLASVIADNGTVLARTDSSWTWVYNCTKGGPLSDAQLQARSVVGNNGSVSCDRYCHGINRAPWNWELPYSWNGARGVGPAYPQDAGGICICQKTGGGWS